MRRRMIRQLAGNGEDQGAPPKTLEEAADRFLTTAAGIPGDGARGWELSGESRQLGRWKDLLTVAIDSYEFTGGAHGLPVTRWLNWDLTAHRPVSLGQVINPGQEDAFEAAARTLPAFEERREIGRQILDDRKIAQWLDTQAIVLKDPTNVRATGPPRSIIDGHGARAAHTNPTGKPIGERWIDLPLHPGDNVQNRLVVLPRNLVGTQRAVFAPAPDLNDER